MKPHLLDNTMRAVLDRRRAHDSLRTLTTAPPSSTDFSSNDFLSLSTAPALRAAYLHELSTSASFRLGSSGSRLLDGNSPYAEALERAVAAFHRAPAGLLFNSGFDANAGLFSCLPQPGDVVLYDASIHASVHDGMRLSRAGERLPFAHNSVVDLRRLVEACVRDDALVRAGRRNVLVAVEGLYSMEGDLAPLVGIVELVEELLPLGNGLVVVDEAHSTGVYGARGRGIVCSLGLEDRVFARLHTFGKGLACHGAIVLCSTVTRDYLVNYAKTLIYTTAMSFPSLAAIKVVYSLMEQGGTESLTRHLNDLIAHLYLQLQLLKPHARERGRGAGVRFIEIPREMPQSPIFSLLTPEPRSLAKYCQDGGFVVRAIVPPTVPEGTQRVRVCLHAGNTFKEVEDLGERIRGWLEMEDERDVPELAYVKPAL